MRGVTGMRLLRWLVRLVGVAFLAGAFLSTFAVLVWPRWFTAAGASLVCICSTLASVLFIVASFMPRFDKLKQASAPIKPGQVGTSKPTGRCGDCNNSAEFYCIAHCTQLCQACRTVHLCKGCQVIYNAQPARSVTDAHK